MGSDGGVSEDATGGHTRVSRLYLRLLGLALLLAFASVAVQVTLLIGSRGLLPIAPLLDAIRANTGRSFLPGFPTLFWFNASDRALSAAAWTGAAIGAALLLGLRSRVALAVAWALFLSIVVAGRSFFTFQWDNLLLESTFLALFLPMPWLANRPGRPGPPPSRVIVWLFYWLLFRLYFESGISKLLPGAQGWTDLSAMSVYFETAPLPSWPGWFAHQMPLGAAQAMTAFTLVVEIVVPLLIFVPTVFRGGPRFARGLRAKHVALGIFTALQAGIFFTANYGYFNVLSAFLGVWLLDDRDLEAIARRLRMPLRPLVTEEPPRWRAPWLAVAGSLLLIASLMEGALLFRSGDDSWPPPLAAFRRICSAARIAGSYHLFASMTERRIEVTIEGSDDGRTWSAFRLRYKPGDPARRPPIVAPHQPRVDFLLWFFTLGPPGRPGQEYLETLLRRICQDPAAVAQLWASDPFHGKSPAFVRLGFDDYRFTDRATRRATGRWWRIRREAVGRTLSCADLRR